MKMKLTDYAETLVNVLDDETDLETVAENFWKVLKKNDQLKVLPKILALLDEAYAKKNNMTVAYVASSEALNSETREMIRKNLEHKSGQKVILKEEVNPSLLAGILVKHDGDEYDFSMQNQIFKLKQHLV